jgi:hypothetical protein
LKPALSISKLLTEVVACKPLILRHSQRRKKR